MITELFYDISEQVREQVAFWLEVSFSKETPLEIAQTYLDYVKSLESETAKEYAEFAFFCKVEELLKGE